MRRQIRWELERGRLARHVERADGRAYTHRCELPALKEVCWYVEEHAKDGVTTGELWQALGAVRQCSVAAPTVCRRVKLHGVSAFKE